ncbi:hypothetical protein LTR10_002712 [Elasticomyces elasticus]|nr:hypothetical protein LTR10_002712 [Elasticomyces elasticus]
MYIVLLFTSIVVLASALPPSPLSQRDTCTPKTFSFEDPPNGEELFNYYSELRFVDLRPKDLSGLATIRPKNGDKVIAVDFELPVNLPVVNGLFEHHIGSIAVRQNGSPPFNYKSFVPYMGYFACSSNGKAVGCTVRATGRSKAGGLVMKWEKSFKPTADQGQEMAVYTFYTPNELNNRLGGIEFTIIEVDTSVVSLQTITFYFDQFSLTGCDS